MYCTRRGNPCMPKNKINQNYTILTDVGPEIPLCEYFNVNDITFNFISDGNEIPLIDRIMFQANGKKILLIVQINSLLRLCDESSQYNKFSDLVNGNKIKLIYFNPADSRFEIDGSGPFPHIENYCKNNNGNIKKIDKILKELKFVWWGDVEFGEYLPKHFKNAEFYHVHDPFIKLFGSHHFFHLKSHEEKITNTFFSLARYPRNRNHRKKMLDKMRNNDYSKNAIINFHSSDKLRKDIFSDLDAEYGKIHLEKTHWKDSYPVISYYEKTCFELVCETLGEIDGDDTFFVTEKTLKPISMGHPFLILSTKHFLKNLRAMGFKTFGDFTDESYDDCDKVEDRIEILSKNLEKLDMINSKKFYNGTKDICKFNQSHLMYLSGRYKFDLWNNWNIFFDNFIDYD